MFKKILFRTIKSSSMVAWIHTTPVHVTKTRQTNKQINGSQEPVYTGMCVMVRDQHKGFPQLSIN
jgi:hypothetical protein